MSGHAAVRLPWQSPRQPARAFRGGSARSARPEASPAPPMTTERCVWTRQRHHDAGCQRYARVRQHRDQGRKATIAEGTDPSRNRQDARRASRLRSTEPRPVRSSPTVASSAWGMRSSSMGVASLFRWVRTAPRSSSSTSPATTSCRSALWPRLVRCAAWSTRRDLLER